MRASFSRGPSRSTRYAASVPGLPAMHRKQPRAPVGKSRDGANNARMTSPFDSIAACHPVLGEAAAAASEYWDPEPVPLSVGLGALGNALVKAERDIPDEALARVAACVEEALESRGDVRDAVATGFL